MLPHNGARHPLRRKIQLAAWILSAEDSRIKAFQKGLPKSISSHGRQGTHKQYNRPWEKWISWCDQFKTDPVQAPVTVFIDFLLNTFQEGKAYSTVNTYRSAVSITIKSITGRYIGEDHLVTRLMKGLLISKALFHGTHIHGTLP